ncbi:MAG TPA: hypothetical protein VMY36_03560 [Patescibacteria group bacterium]|nr:hypothetical protein [Patescibacteria group bacterium]
MKRVYSLLNQEFIFILFFSFLLLFLSFFPTLYEAFQANNLGDSRRLMLWGEHNYTYDYNVYLAKMRLGAEGRWTVINKYTSESHRGALLQEFYLLTGKVGGWLRLTPPITYHLVRILLAVALLLAIYQLIAFFLRDSFQRKIAFLLALFSGAWPRFVYYNQGWHPALFMDWWQEMDVVRRATYVPHYLFGHLLTIVMLLSLLKRKLVWALVSGLIAGFVHPPSLLIVWGIWGLWILWQIRETLITKGLVKIKDGLFKDDIFRDIKRQIVSFIFLVLVTAIPLLYIQRITSIYPWKALTDFDRLHPLPFRFEEYLLALGITFVLGVGGMILVFWRKKETYLPLVFWVLSAFLAILIFQQIPFQSEVRFIQVAVHLPLAILATLFLVEVSQWLKKKTGQKVLIWLVLLVLLLSLPGIYSSFKGQIGFINQRVAAVLPLVPYPSQVMYPLKGWWQAIVWLGEETKRNEIVLSDVTAGNYIPAYSGNTVYYGHSGETIFFDQKRFVIQRFFNNQMMEDEAFDFLKKNRISYIFFGPQEATLGYFQPYSFLETVFQNDWVIIFKVKTD